ncbi:MAG: hypothetical protein HZC40_14655 [Chloroflexi bacterium]|nr:hypothetical protein [Chloroflexota bacterium]
MASTTGTARRFSWEWIGVVPFFLYALLFLIIPSSFLVIGSFQNAQGGFTLDNFVGLFDETVRNSYTLSLQISLFTALAGGVFGFLMAYAAIAGGLPRFVRSFLLTFSGVASNFSGVPLASAYISTLGRQGMATILIGRQIRGEVLQNPNLGYAVAVGMVVIMSVSIIIYSWLQRKTEGWLR